MLKLLRTLAKFAQEMRCKCVKRLINYCLLLIAVYLHDQRYIERMDLNRQYDDLRGEWAQV